MSIDSWKTTEPDREPAAGEHRPYYRDCQCMECARERDQQITMNKENKMKAIVGPYEDEDGMWSVDDPATSVGTVRYKLADKAKAERLAAALAETRTQDYKAREAAFDRELQQAENELRKKHRLIELGELIAP